MMKEMQMMQFATWMVGTSTEPVCASSAPMVRSGTNHGIAAEVDDETTAVMSAGNQDIL